ncbi:lantibiotic dehydratase [Dyadobacter jiangsuensis]|uniref:Thiopeptide-type bacteriocin biosynthesis protein n=1 Tax=Dyadobacter jiangsuensis TaxID=1591085 RepID=A0A2P8FIF7_9BACT|nr:lantibiotic dehydratase [Dyadobacter jiangsuensis]PSL21513.1 thiopeptide-type bacteriocin biosynthesis protein [Dyadobacter jiangsuensis]
MRLFSKSVVRVPIFPVSCLQDLEYRILNELPLDSELVDTLLEAVYIGSPEFYELIRNDLDSGFIFRDEKIKLSVLKYVNRMCQRGTPFGTMAYLSILDLGDTSGDINLETDGLKRVVRLDSEIAVSLLALIEAKPEYIDAIPLYPNNSIYQIGGKLRFVETTRNGGANKYKLASVDSDSVVKRILKFAKKGKDRSALRQFVHDIFPEGDPEDITDYLEDIIANNILVSSFGLNVSDTDVLCKIESFLARYDGRPTNFHTYLMDSISNLRKLTEASRTCSPTQAIANYKAIREIVSSLLGRVDPSKSVVQVDTFKNLSAKISKKIPHRLGAVLNAVSQINPLYESENFNAFKNSFIERYDSKPVKLMEALDPDIGIGYPVANNIQNEGNDPLLSIVSSTSRDRSNTLQYYFNDWHRFLIGKYQEAKLMRVNEIRLSLADLKAFEVEGKKSLPPAFTVLCKLSASAASDLDLGHYLIQAFDAHAPSAANVYTRFTHLDTTFEDFAGQLINEQRKDSEYIDVEFEHIGQVRTANVALKRISRKKRINITCSPVPDRIDDYLPLDDLYLHHMDGRLFLYSKMLKENISPFMTSAYNFSIDDLPIVSFIGDFQQQGNQNNLLWDWGPLREFDDLPRVLIDGNVVASPAFWTIRKRDLDVKSFSSFVTSFERLCENKSVVQRVLYGAADNLLLLDLKNVMYLQILYKDILRAEHLLFIEDIHQQCGNFVGSKGGVHSSEFLFSFATENPHPKATTLPKRLATAGYTSHIPLDDWVYFKLYFGSSAAEQQIMKMLDSLIQAGRRKNLIDRWFFMRYEDPEPHIRVRVKKKFDDSLNCLIGIINKEIGPMLKQGLLRKVLYDSYVPELERYGMQNMDSIEKIFQIDSEFVLVFRRMFDQFRPNDELNWLVGMATIDLYTSLFFANHENEERENFCVRIKDSLKAEFNFSIDSFKRLNKFFSDKKELFKKFMDENDESYASLRKLLNQRKVRLRREIEGIECDQSVVFSVIHMSFNRLFPIGPRKNEAISYDFFCKHFLKTRS